MTEAPHLTNQQFAGFQARTLAPAELLAVDQHLADCVECRDRLAREIHAPEQLAGLRELLSEHLEYHQLVAAAQGTPDSASDAHLAVCPMCRDEVEDLRQFQSSLKTRPRVVEMPVRRPAWRIPAYAAIAAGLLLAAGLAIRGRRQEPTAPEQPIAQTAPTQPAEPALAPEQQAAVQLALSTHRLERAGVLDTLITKPSVLLGAAPQQKSFEVKAPVGTTVLTDRPLFSWREVPGASKYQVAVFDNRFQKVAESPALKVAEWTPRVPLTPGHVYSWQVTAYIDGRTLLSPAPPAPEARFEVTPPDTAQRIENARRQHPGNHLLLAVLLAEAGALDESELELDALAASDPQTAQALRQSLRDIRKPLAATTR